MSIKDDTIFLVLKEPWFSMIKSGEKKEEYRELTDYWLTRFGSATKHIDCKKGTSEILYFYPYSLFKQIHFVLGMPKKGTQPEKHLFFKNPKIRIDYGRPEWGAEPGKKYFVITWNCQHGS